jgi:hypothetical protein
MEEEIPLEDLKVGDRVIAHQFGRPGELGKTSFKGVVSDIIREPPYRFRGKRIEGVKVWLDTGRGAARDIGLNFTIGTAPQWVFVEDPAVQTKRNARSLAEILALGKDKPENGELLDGRVQDPLRKYTAEYLGLKKTAKKGGRRRRKTRKSRT